MRDITQQWLNYAETDLRTCEEILSNDFLTNVVAFHSQQVAEKCFKAIIEENNLQLPRIHSLSRLYGTVQNIITFEVNQEMLQKSDTVYTTSRYPSDLGLIPDGKPSIDLAQQLYEFAKYIYYKTVETIDK